MTGRIRKAICEKLSLITQQNNLYYELEVPAKKHIKDANKPTLHWTISGKMQEQQYILNSIPKLNFNTDFVHDVRIEAATEKNMPRIEFQLQPQAFTDALLCENSNSIAPMEDFNDKHIVIDFSSPNIAKPFHVGHLRSTIIGNVLGNLHKHLGYKVTKLNYLGDWGTQFGMLHVGVEMAGITDEEMRRKPIETLYRAYVTANEAAKQDTTTAERARRCFKELEEGINHEMAVQWQKYREYTVAELESTYERLGVRFDKYDWESQYSQREISYVLQALAHKSLLLDEVDGRKVVQVGDRRVPIMKSDGSTLYLARDIAALIDRYHRYHFEQILYVVDNAQTDHFNALFTTTAALLKGITLEHVNHVKFGRIHGMSTRSGNVVFLRDILDEARDIMLEKQLNSPTTKIELSSHSSDTKVADILGVSAVIVNDLKQRRQRDYDFDWNKALQMNGDTGIKLQYTHCRLHSLLERVAEVADIGDVKSQIEHLMEPEAQDVLYEIARFEQTLWHAKQQSEACIIVNYLFALCNATSRALKRLNVKNETCPQKQQQRILLFQAAKRTLKQGMLILGLKPLNKM